MVSVALPYREEMNVSPKLPHPYLRLDISSRAPVACGSSHVPVTRLRHCTDPARAGWGAASSTSARWPQRPSGALLAAPNSPYPNSPYPNSPYPNSPCYHPHTCPPSYRYTRLQILYFLIRFILRKRAERTQLTPVTVLTDVKGQPAHGPGPPGAIQGLSYPQLAPDGKPIMAFGSHYPPPTSLQLMVMAGHMGHLPPTAGDALIQAAVSSREAYNGAPIRTAPPLVLPPQYGLPGPNMSTAPGGAGGPMPYSAASVLQQASPPGATPSPGPDSGPLPLPMASPGSESPLPMSRPAILTPPAAATLDNPVAANDAVNAHPYR